MWILLVILLILAIAAVVNLGFWGFIIDAAVVAVVVFLGIKLYKRNAEKEIKEKEEREIKENAEKLEREKQEQERKEQYKKDLLSGAISYDKEIELIMNNISLFSKYINKISTKMSSLAKELRADSLDAIDETKRLKMDSPPYLSVDFSVLKEIKNDPAVDILQKQADDLMKEYNALRLALWKAQNKL